MIQNFNEWLDDKQSSGRYTTKLYLDGDIECQADHKIYHLKGIYYVDSMYNNGIYSCINETGIGISAKHGDLVKIVKRVYSPQDLDNWAQQPNVIGLSSADKTQYVDTFNGTLWYIVLMVLVSLFNERIIAWISITIIYFTWKYMKRN